MELHPDCVQIAYLLGTWRGEGKGEYPTIQPFAYGEEIRFWHVGKPVFAYSQKTWSLEDDAPRHSEFGFWRPVAPGKIEVVLAHPTGVAEIEEGVIDGTCIRVTSRSVTITSTAKQVTALARTIRVDDGVLSYDLHMGAVGVPLTHHLTARLERVGD